MKNITKAILWALLSFSQIQAQSLEKQVEEKDFITIENTNKEKNDFFKNFKTHLRNLSNTIETSFEKINKDTGYHSFRVSPAYINTYLKTHIISNELKDNFIPELFLEESKRVAKYYVGRFLSEMLEGTLIKNYYLRIDNSLKKTAEKMTYRTNSSYLGIILKADANFIGFKTGFRTKIMQTNIEFYKDEGNASISFPVYRTTNTSGKIGAYFFTDYGKQHEIGLIGKIEIK